MNSLTLKIHNWFCCFRGEIGFSSLTFDIPSARFRSIGVLIDCEKRELLRRC